MVGTARSGLRALSVLLMMIVSQACFADAQWLASGDIQLRNDLLLLNDARVIRLPVGQWPIPRAAVTYALSNAKQHFATNAAVMAALERVRARVASRESRHAGLPIVFDASVTGGSAGLLRSFETLGREDGEVRGGAELSGEHAAISLSVTAVTGDQDDQKLRADGSHATVLLGNWLISANSLDRWWGPGHDGSLILSSNARPMPTLMVERATAQEFKSSWLSWIGPWRMSFGVSRMEDHRIDIDAPLFMAWRVEIMPFKDIELGFSRTAQFCGKQLECNLNVFGNLLAGNDNVGIDATAADEPGNQMAGFDIRWASPIGNWPYAVYSQMIGEDESSYVPSKYIEQFGLESWKSFGDGAILQGFIEYADTTCSDHTSRGPYYNCAYNQGRFNSEGYRYRGRVLGLSTDNDAESYALGATYTDAAGRLWSATARDVRLNRDGPDSRNTVSAGPSKYQALELGWRGTVAGQKISVNLGVETLEPLAASRKTDAFGFVNWQHEFAP